MRSQYKPRPSVAERTLLYSAGRTVAWHDISGIAIWWGKSNAFKCACIAILLLGICPKELFRFWKDVGRKIFRATLFTLARIRSNLNAQQLRVTQVNSSIQWCDGILHYSYYSILKEHSLLRETIVCGEHEPAWALDSKYLDLNSNSMVLNIPGISSTRCKMVHPSQRSNEHYISH